MHTLSIRLTVMSFGPSFNGVAYLGELASRSSRADDYTEETAYPRAAFGDWLLLAQDV